MTFSWALETMGAPAPVKRDEWTNGESMEIKTIDDVTRIYYDDAVNGPVVWVPTQVEILATDWAYFFTV